VVLCFVFFFFLGWVGWIGFFIWRCDFFWWVVFWGIFWAGDVWYVVLCFGWFLDWLDLLGWFLVGLIVSFWGILFCVVLWGLCLSVWGICGGVVFF